MLIQSVDRAVAILDLFKKHKQLDLGEITKLIGLSKSTVHTLIKTLEEKNLLRKDESTKKYKLGYSILELGLKQLAELDINKHATQPLKKLTNDVNRICSVSIWDDNTVLVTFRTDLLLNNVYGFSSVPPVRRKPAYCTSIGKVLLAFLPGNVTEKYLNEVELRPFTKNTITSRDSFIEELAHIRNQGYAIDRKEYVSYMMSISAPVYGNSGRIEGGISIFSDPDDNDEASLSGFIDPLMRTAYEISIDMGYQPEPM